MEGKIRLTLVMFGLGILIGLALGSLSWSTRESTAGPAINAAAIEPVLSGAVGTHDGITLGYSVRLWGIGTPDRKRRCPVNGKCVNCAKVAHKHLKNLTKDMRVQCRIVESSEKDGLLGECRATESWRLGEDPSFDVAERLLRNGWAVAYRGYIDEDPILGPRYRRAETEAKEAGRGIWASAALNQSLATGAKTPRLCN